MTEKLNILQHHVREIEDNEIFGKGIEEISSEVKHYVKKHIDGHKAYEFANEEQRQNFIKAIEKAAAAISADNCEQVSDFKDEKETFRNFDLICANCPNFALENNLFVCMAEVKFNNFHEMSMVKK